MNPNPADTLRAAADAWRRLTRAEGELSRLGRYNRLSPAMRDDRANHSQAAAKAREDLRTLLGGAP